MGGSGGTPLYGASIVVRGFASATNLLIAGRRFLVRGESDRAHALRALLAALGAREATDGDPVDYLFCTERVDSDAVAEMIGGRVDSAGSSPLLVIDASVDAPAIDLASLGAVDVARPGVLATTLADTEVFLVPRSAPGGDADAAQHRIEWARRFMPVSAALGTELAESGVLSGIRVGVSMVLEPKTAVLALLLRDAGAEVSVYAHSDETDDDVAEVLRRAGLPVFADGGATPAEERALALAFLDRMPQVLLDDGSHVIRLAHLARPALIPTMIGAAEETTSGLRPLRAMQAAGALALPVVAVNDARSKTLFDNLYGTGQSCVFAILDLIETDLSGRTVVVVGFGHVGEGVARTAAALGASIVVAETDPVRALQAVFAGYRVAPLIEAVATADLVISATGVARTIGLDVMLACAADAVIAVAGGVPQEIAIDDAVAAGVERVTVRPKVERFDFPGGSRVIVLDDGGCINITAGEGNPIEIMDLSFGVQLGAIRFLVQNGPALAPGVHPIPTEVDDRVAELALRRSGHDSDRMAARQRASELSWLPTRFLEADDL
jgi:adenosylhomocysteinase